jgi:hypothetical protein
MVSLNYFQTIRGFSAGTFLSFHYGNHPTQAPSIALSSEKVYFRIRSFTFYNKQPQKTFQFSKQNFSTDLNDFCGFVLFSLLDTLA